MFRSKKNREPDELDKAIAATHSRMERFGPGSEEYPKLLKDLKKLLALKDGTSRRWKKPSTDTLVIAGFGLLQVVIIVAYESTAHVLTSKAVGLVNKPKL